MTHWSCPDNVSSGSSVNSSHAHPGPNIFPAVDFDLVLCTDFTKNNGSEDCIMISESEQDTVEGFDVLMDDNYDNLAVFAIWPADQQLNCEGGSNATLHWATSHWR